jgi:hypothetical protein
VVVLASDEGSNTKYLLWNIEKVDGNYAFKSDSTGAYLDGRNPEHALNQLWLTNRLRYSWDCCLVLLGHIIYLILVEPRNKSSLLWQVLQIGSLAQAIHVCGSIIN